MVLRYRDLQRPEQVDTQYVDTGQADTARELARAFQTFGNTVQQVATPILQKQGAEAGAAAGASGNPNFKTGWRLMTAFGQAYNNAATRSYSLRAEADAEDQAARLEADAGNDPTKFAATFGAVMQATLKSAPPEARAVLTDVYSRRMAEGRMRLAGAQAKEMHDQSRTDLQDGITRSVDRIARMRASDDPVQAAQADEEEAKLRLMVDGAANDGTISAVERDALHKGAYDQILMSTVVDRFQKELDSPYGNPIKFLQNLAEANKTSEALSPEQEGKLQDLLMATLRDHNALLSAGESAANAARAERWAAGDQKATAALLDGSLTNSMILQMVQSGDLKPEIARTLREQLKSGGAGPVSNAHALFDVETNLLALSEAEIGRDSRLSWDDRRRLIEERRKAIDGWRGSVRGREGFDRLKRALGIQEGTNTMLLSDAEVKQLSDAQTDYFNTVDALPPEQREAAAIPMADEMIKKYNLRTREENVRNLEANAARAEARANDTNLSDRDRKLAADNAKRWKQQAQALQQGGK